MKTTTFLNRFALIAFFQFYFTFLATAQEWGSISFPGTVNSGMNADYTSITTGKITIETWVYYDNNAGIIASNMGGNQGFLMGFDGWFKFQVGGTAQWVDPTGWKSKWTHLACVLDGSNIIVYANGVEVGKTAFTSAYSDYPGIPLYVGRAPWGNPFTGKVADFRVWNIARSAAEIAANYKSKVAPTSPGLYINYDFAEQTSDHTANLVSGNNTGWLMETATTNYTWGYMARIPQNLVISNKTANGFDLSWESGWDNIWEVSITDANNTTTSYTNLTSKLKSFTGLTFDPFSVKVRTTSPTQTDWSTPKVVSLSTGVSENQMTNLKVSNQNGLVSINGLEGDNSIVISNVSGAIVSQFKVSKSEFQINTSNWIPGMYIFNLNNGVKSKAIKIIQ